MSENQNKTYENEYDDECETFEEQLYFECPACNDITPHDLIKKVESKKLLRYTVKCQDCGNVHNIEKRCKLQHIKVVVSRYNQSEQFTIDIPDDEKLSVGDTIEVKGENVEITSVELEGSRRVESAFAKDIKMIWAKSLDVPKKVNISVSAGGITRSFSVLVSHNQAFEEDQVYRAGELFFRIKRIKTEKGYFTREVARKIVRIYSEPVSPMRDFIDLTDYVI
ncbi:HVO_0476 family zinc finger protein [Methanococcus voltae]|jgi:uncharacterized Zn finger protein|uniref:Zn finger protein n=2 Tax=Methanococcus voltae TaxID=2188 RepID=A0ABT2EV08_METVO|nr:HVO_0476 family zinc finger protein [Methanococcus voltae]MBP2171980.1 putative Zn finger protein [Methanococcus voltae]MBP2201065.1 putative Zn finger protein [Methanococcus voltae]MCS3921788.1 putative Zn finger protein [Methanococcus voltae PS]